jgi:serine protease inhibitor
MRRHHPWACGGYALAVALTATLAGCGGGESPTSPAAPITTLPRQLTADEQAVVAGSNAFGLDLFRRVYAAGQGSDIFLSPFSASMALGMTLNGAANGTFDAMRSVLGFDTLSQASINGSYRGLLSLLSGLDPRVQLSIANAVWTNSIYPIVAAFQDSVRSAFDADARSAAFADPATVDAINAWVRDRTAGKIDGIVDQLNSGMVALLVNATYFKGIWTLQFDPKQTSPGPFTLADGSTVQVSMMHLAATRLPHEVTSTYEAVDLGYGGGAFSMTIVVPRPGISLGDVVASLDDAGWRNLVAGLDSVEIGLNMPKLQLRDDRYLNAPLSAMGMGVAFTPQADFSKLTSVASCISYVRQKSYVDVNEEGTEAAAVTGVGVGITAVPPSMDVDRPFVFAIRDRLTGTILFMGAVENPSAAQAPAPAAPATQCG